MNHKKFIIYVILFWLFIVFLGCAPKYEITNLSPAYLKLEPSISSYEDPTLMLKSYYTFTVFPNSVLSDNSEIQGILEKQMLYALRNIFEMQGYKFVQIEESPDFIATIDASSPYREVYIPPQTVSVPYWVPSRRITTQIESSGTFDFSTWGDYSSYGWGTWSSSSYATTTVPGYFAPLTYTRPGYSVGNFYPSVTIRMLDGKTLENVWTGIGVGTSIISDVRISSQFVLLFLRSKVPGSVQIELMKRQKGNGMIGIYNAMLTNDGNNYFPTVMKIVPNSPAEKSGIEVFDMILTVDGKSMRNVSWLDAMLALDGNAGDNANLSIWRVDKKHDFSITRILRDFD